MVEPRKHRVLLVDDDDALLQLLDRVLEAAGFEVHVAADAARGVEVFRSVRPDVVVSDVSMPKGGGLELLREIRREDPAMPFVLMSGNPTLESALDAVNNGADRYLTKPIGRHQLVDAIHQAVVGRAKTRKASHGGGRRVSSDDFRLALDQLWVAFQPVVSISRRAIFGYEALLRTPRMGPQEVLEAAEQHASLVDVGRAVRDRAASASLSGASSTLLFLNLHSQDLLDEHIYAETSPLSALAPRVVLEITERAPLAEIPDLKERLARLRAQGFRLAVDDLGAGYAGLTSLNLVQPEFVKLDRELVTGIDTSATLRKVVSSTIRMTEDLGAEVIAEGIETYGECQTLVDLGCDLLQGFLFAQPAAIFPEVTWPNEPSQELIEATRLLSAVVAGR